MGAITIKDVTFNNVPNKKKGTKIANMLTQSNITISQTVNEYLQSDEFYKFISALDIDWGRIQIDNNITIEDTADLINWIKSLEASRDYNDLINTPTGLIIKQEVPPGIMLFWPDVEGKEGEIIRHLYLEQRYTPKSQANIIYYRADTDENGRVFEQPVYEYSVDIPVVQYDGLQIETNSNSTYQVQYVDHNEEFKVEQLNKNKSLILYKGSHGIIKSSSSGPTVQFKLFSIRYYMYTAGQWKEVSLNKKIYNWALQPTKPDYSYSEISNTPTIPEAQIQADWNQLNNSSVDFIKNKPTIPTNVSDLTNDSNFATVEKLQSGFVKEIQTHEYVEIGGIKWATMNIGATTETDYGNYYKYGLGKNIYNRSQSYYDGIENPLNKNVDTVAQEWGGKWRMPTKTELESLIENSDYTQENNFNNSGVNGIKFTDKNDNTKYIFIPASGCYFGSYLEGRGDYCYLWSSSPYGSSSTEAYGLELDTVIFISRSMGIPVRGVYDDSIDIPTVPDNWIQSDWDQNNSQELDYIKNKPTIPSKISDLTDDSNFITTQKLSSGFTTTAQTHEFVIIGNRKWAKTNIGAISETDYGDYFQLGKINTYQESRIEPVYEVSGDQLPLNVDTVAQRWGGGWRMPTNEEFQELMEATNYTWEINFNNSGINGGKFTSKTDNTKYLFFPAAGMYRDSYNVLFNRGNVSMLLSSSTNNNSYPLSALYLISGSRSFNLNSDLSIGCSVRGIYDETISTPIITPTIPDNWIQPDWNQTDSTALDYIKNKPNVVNGISGEDGKSAYELYVETVPNGETPLTLVEWIDSLKGQGKSAYELYVENVPSGETILTENEWLESLHSQDGITPTINITPISGGNNIAFNYGVGDSRNTNFNVMNGSDAPSLQQIQADWNQINSSSLDYIKNKPTIPTKTSDLTNDSYFTNKQKLQAGFAKSTEHDYVEIGGVKWATMNVGANSETDYGNYYQWGAIETYQNTDQYYTGTNTLPTSRDIVALTWWGNWRMPTKVEFDSLIESTNYTWETNFNGSGVNGGKFTDKTDSSKYVFFPAAGIYYDGRLYDVGSEGEIWNSTPDVGDNAYRLYYFDIDNDGSHSDNRRHGYSVRGVLDDSDEFYNTNSPTTPDNWIQPDWNQDDPDQLDYIKNKPTTFSDQVQSDWTETDSSKLSYIRNKPTISQQVQADWTETSSVKKSYIKNKPKVNTINGYSILVSDNAFSPVDIDARGNWNETNTNSIKYIENKPTIRNDQEIYNISRNYIPVFYDHLNSSFSFNNSTYQTINDILCSLGGKIYFSIGIGDVNTENILIFNRVSVYTLNEMWKLSGNITYNTQNNTFEIPSTLDNNNYNEYLITIINDNSDNRTITNVRPLIPVYTYNSSNSNLDISL